MDINHPKRRWSHVGRPKRYLLKCLSLGFWVEGMHDQNHCWGFFLLFIHSATVSVPLTSFRDEAYAVDVAFGTPRQILKLSIDINSDYSANVYSVLCWQCCRHARYDWRKTSAGECRYEDSQLSFASCNDSLEVSVRLFMNSGMEAGQRKGYINEVQGGRGSTTSIQNY